VTVAKPIGALRLPTPRRGFVPVTWRTLVIGAVLILVGSFFLVLAVSTGDLKIPLDRVIPAMLGTGNEGEVLVVRQWRLPRALMALLLGAALGIGGAIFQSLTRNPLGSPDIIGFGTGAYTGALVVILLMGGSYIGTATGALVGGVATALVVYLLSISRGVGRRGVQGFRLIIVGIGVSAMLSAFNTWLILKAEVEDAMRVAIWGAGSLNGMSWEQVTPTLVVMAVMIAAALVLAERMHLLEMGDESATALGIRVEPTRLALMSALAGPISFVALAAPQIARRLTRTAGVAIGPAALTGAVLLLISDYVAQRIHPTSPLPVGVITVSVGGVYLVGLLISEGRKRLR
jgi:iron complex transport system permease protein